MRKFKLLALIVLFATITGSQSYSQRKMESLDRSVIAIKKSNGVFISWRITGNELRNVSYNIYRDGHKITSSPITDSSNYTDSEGVESSTYTVTAIFDGSESAPSKTATVWAQQYLDIPVQSVNGSWSGYTLNDASVGDLDGDGEYEIIVKRLAVNKDITSTDYNLLEAYKLDGTFMWRINMGPNIYDGTECNFLVWDFDQDGKAEVATRTSDGMIDGVGTNIGDRDNDGLTNYRSSISAYGYRTAGPDYISVFNGETGAEITWDNYIERDPLTQWGSTTNVAGLSHRATKTMWTVAYLDGKHPSIVNGRGIYERIKMEAWDFNGSSLTKRWAWDSAPGGVHTIFSFQGNHNLSCADVDNDGRDEIIYGSMTIDDNGTGLYSTQTGHGDALHVSDMDPDRPGLEIWNCLEGSNDWGATLRDAKTGNILVRYRSNRDCGRACAGDINPNVKGYEIWAATECPMYNTKGDVVGTNNVPVNHMIWWDGDLSREFLNHSGFSDVLGYGTPSISKYSPETKSAYEILSATGTASNNWTKGNPSLQADILGDWREELVVRTTDNKNIRIYSTINPTSYRMPTLMHESQYRIAVAWQNNSYNQPPHTSIYLGNETKDAVPYNISNGRIIWKTGSNWDTGSQNWEDEDGNSTSYDDNNDVLFDFLGDNTSDINITTAISPRSVLVNSFTDYTFSGTGKLTGNMELLKTGTGKLTLNNADNDFNGVTKVYYGDLVVNGALSASLVDVCMFGKLYLNGTLGNGLIIKTDGELCLGNDNAIAGNGSVTNGATLQKNATCYFDLSDDPTGITKNNDKLTVTGNLTIEGKITFNINRLDAKLNPGFYDLIQYSGTFVGDTGNIILEGIPDVACQMVIANNKVSLEVLEVRAATNLIWKGDESNIWDFAGAKNWLNGTDNDWFLGFDSVTFNNEGVAQNNINITEIVPIGSMIVDGDETYAFSGNGEITGTGGLIKNGTSKLFINNQNSYTGSTVLNKGLVEVPYLSDAETKSPLGAATADANNFVFNGGVLSLTNGATTTNRNIKLDTGGGTIFAGAGVSLTLNGSLSGTGDFIKEGSGIINFMASNTMSGNTIIRTGTLKLASTNAETGGFGSGSVIIQNGTLDILSNINSSVTMNWNIEVPQGYMANINLDGRSSMTGSLTGGGNLNIYTPYIRTDLIGDWSAFTGKITTSTDSDGGWLVLGNSKGYGNASIDLSDNITILHNYSNDVTIEIGQLTGTAKSYLGAGGQAANTITWKIGGKNTSFTFDGIINNAQYKNSGAKAAIIKAGSGRMTVTNSNTYSGGTTIEKGTLIVNNTTGSGTGTGSVTVKTGGVLSGTGNISGYVTVNSGGYLFPGETPEIGDLTISNSVTINAGGYLISNVKADTKESDKVIVSGTLNVNGTNLYLNKLTGSYSNGDQFKIVQCSNIVGNIATVTPSSPGTGLYWDLSEFNTNGVIKVTNTVGFNDNRFKNISLYPNPTDGVVSIDLSNINGVGTISFESLNGKLLRYDDITGNQIVNIQLNDLNSGIYMVKILINNQLFINKLIIK